MLVLARKVGESIIVDGPCKIIVTSMKNGQVRLGIEAPQTTDIWREEVWDQRQEQAKEQANDRS